MSKLLLKKTCPLHNEIYLDIYVDFRNLNLRYQLDTNFFIHLDKMKILNLNLDNLSR